MRIDLHVHSKHSRRPSQWILQKIGCPESFSEPFAIYQAARDHGMDLVTITDHNCIDAAAELAHLPGTFISEEVTSYFPDDRCKVHVLALNIDEKQHREIQAVRDNLFDLVAYLNGEKIFHILAHPLYAVNGKLTAHHVEILLLLFRHLELNGSRSAVQNRFLEKVVAGLTPRAIMRLADRHGIAPVGERPWVKVLTGGSDDHSCLNIARTCTEVPEVRDLQSFIAGLSEGRGVVSGRPATPQTMAHNLYGIAFQYYKHRFQLDRHVKRDPLLQFLDRSLSPQPEVESGWMSRLVNLIAYRRRGEETPGVSDSLMALLRRETRRLIREHPELAPASGGPQDSTARETRWFAFVNQVSNRVLRHFADHLLGHLSGGNLFSLFNCLSASGGLYTLLAPYFVAYAHFGEARALEQELLAELNQPATAFPPAEEHVAHFSDTFYDINGVALTLQQQVQTAIRLGRRLTMVTCAPEPPSRPGVRNFDPIGCHRLPDYPQQALYTPPLLDMLDWCHSSGITRIVSATPGPVGLAALAIARILHLPISGTYHTQLPQYALQLTGDGAMEELTWRYVLWYYDAMEIVWAPSESTRRELVERGLRRDKVRLYPRGADVERFTPAKRNGYLKKHFGIDARCTLLYVGRLSLEKNLSLLAEAFTTLAGRHAGLHLVVVGDGPYRSEMQQRLREAPATFTGTRQGEDLAMIYASADLFVFPSATDTFGNVVMEAQASGLPVVVSDRGGPIENMLPGRTGVVVPADDPSALLAALESLVADPGRLGEMGRAARAYMESRSFDDAFEETWRTLGQPEMTSARSG